MISTSDDEILETNEDQEEIYEDEFHVGFGGDEQVMQSVWTKTHNELGKFQSQRRPDMMRNNYETAQFDFDQAYQSGKFCAWDFSNSYNWLQISSHKSQLFKLHLLDSGTCILVSHI